MLDIKILLIVKKFICDKGSNFAAQAGLEPVIFLALLDLGYPSWKVLNNNVIQMRENGLGRLRIR